MSGREMGAVTPELLLQVRLTHPRLRSRLRGHARSVPVAVAVAAAIAAAALATGADLLGVFAGAAAVGCAQLIVRTGADRQRAAEAVLRQLAQLPEGRSRQLLRETAAQEAALVGRLRRGAQR